MKLSKKEFLIKYITEKLQKVSGKKVILQNIVKESKEVKTKKVLNESSNNNDPEYKYYGVSVKLKKLFSGFEYQSDAQDFVNEQNEYGDMGPFKVYSKRFLISKGINPDDDENWYKDQPLER